MPTDVLHLGSHLIGLTITDENISYQRFFHFNVTEPRAPIFQPSIEGNNYTAFFKITNITFLSNISSPDGVNASVRIVNGTSFVNLTSDFRLDITAKTFPHDIGEHNLTLEVFHPNISSNTTFYTIRVRIINTPPFFQSPLIY